MILLSIFHPSLLHVIYISTLYTSMRLFGMTVYLALPLEDSVEHQPPSIDRYGDCRESILILIYFFVCHSGMDRKHHIDTCNVMPSHKETLLKTSKSSSIFATMWTIDFLLLPRFSVVLLRLGTHPQTL